MDNFTKYATISRVQQLLCFAIVLCGFLCFDTEAWGQTNTNYGVGSLNSNTGTWNSAFGYRALYSNLSGFQNAAFGGGSLYYNTLGHSNSAFGDDAVHMNTTGSENSGFGDNALYSCTTGSRNAAMGSAALYANTVGFDNTAMGAGALHDNTTGNDNAALGQDAMRHSTSAYYCVAVGSRALYENLTGVRNTAVGYEALASNKTGLENASFGMHSMYANVSGAYNAGLGCFALGANVNGLGNTSVGAFSMGYNNSGWYNTGIGYDALRHNKTGYYNVALGAFAGPAYGSTNMENTIAIGYETVVTTSNTARIGNSDITSIGGIVGWTTLSDGRFKTDVRENVPGLAFIRKLRPVTYRYDVAAYDRFLGLYNGAGEGNSPGNVETRSLGASEVKEAIVYTGFVAQEVDKAAKELSFDFSGVDKPTNTQTPYGLRYAEFVVPMVRAIQEQQEIIDTQRSYIGQLEQRIEKIERMMAPGSNKAGSGDKENTGVLVYPNPTTGMITVSMHNEGGSAAQLQVSDAAGRVLQSKTVSGENIDVVFDLSGYSSGNYMLTITQGKEQTSRTITLRR